MCLALRRLSKRDVEVELAKRVFPAPGGADLYGVPFPRPGANDVTMMIMGMAITFIMGVKRAAANAAPEYYIRTVRFWNQTTRNIQFKIMVAGVKWVQGFWTPDFQDVEAPPAGASTFDFFLEDGLGPRCPAYEGA